VRERWCAVCDLRFTPCDHTGRIRTKARLLGFLDVRVALPVCDDCTLRFRAWRPRAFVDRRRP